MKKVLPIVACGLVLTLTACGGKAETLPERTKHKDYYGYKASFYDTATSSWTKKSGLNWAQSYDQLIKDSKTLSGKIRTEVLHQCEDILMDSGAICPLYYYTDIYMKDSNMTGFYDSPMGYKWFNRAKVGTATEFTVCVGPKADNLDPALNSAVDGAIIASHNFEGLMRWAAPTNGHVADHVEEAVADSYTKNVDPTTGEATYVFHIRDNAKWSDGTKVTPTDFKYSWTRAAGGQLSADYGYMFDCIKGYSEVAADTKGTVDFSGVVADDSKNTLTVTIVSDLPYFTELTAFPAYYPVQKTQIAKGNSWWTDASTYVGNGPMKATKIENKDGGSFEFVQNDNYWDKANNVATKITFALSDDDDNQWVNFTNGTWKFIDSIPQGQIDECEKSRKDKDYFVDSQLGTYYVIFNVNDKTCNNYLHCEDEYATFRKALSLLIDRNYICKNIGKSGQKPANGFVGYGIQAEHEGDPEGSKSEWTAHNGLNRDGKGYFDVTNTSEAFKANTDKAVTMLKSLGFKYDESTQKFTNVPAISYLYNNGTGHKAIGEYLQSAFAVFGITLNLESQEWAVFLNTRKDGNFSIARNGWLGDYSDASTFLDMWTTSSGNNDAQFGK